MYRFAQMAVDGLFEDKGAKETPSTSKDKSKKHVAPGSKVQRFIPFGHCINHLYISNSSGACQSQVRRDS